MLEATLTASDWIKGILYSILASIIGGASKLAIRKSWLIIENMSQNDASDGLISDWQQPHHNESSKVEASPSFGITLEMEGTAHEKSQNNLGHSNIHNNNNNNNNNMYQGSFGERNDHSPQRNVKSLHAKSFTLRAFGFIGMSFLNPMCSVMAMNYASPSILAPFSGLTLIWIIMFSDMLIGEKPSSKQIVASLLIILGQILIAVFGDHTNDNDTSIADLQKSYQNPAFIGFFVGFTIWTGTLFLIMWKSSNKYYRMCAWSLSGGSITGLQNFLKDSLTINKAIGRTGARYPWYFYLFVILAMLSAFVGLLLLTACMKRYDATFSAATFVGSFIISATIMSAIHYHTFQNLHKIQNYILYPVGILILLTGVEILVVDKAQSMQNDSDCFDEIDEDHDNSVEYESFCADNYTN